MEIINLVYNSELFKKQCKVLVKSLILCNFDIQ